MTQALLWLLLCASAGGRVLCISLATSSGYSGTHTPAVVVRHSDLEAEVSGVREGAPAVYRRAKTSNQKATTAAKANARKADNASFAAANKAAGAARQKAAKDDPEGLQKQRAERSQQRADRKKDAREVAPGGAKAQRTAEHDQRLKAKTAHQSAAASLKSEIAKDPSVGDKWIDFKDHVSRGGHHYDPSAVKTVNSKPYKITSAKASAGTAMIEFQGRKNPATGIARTTQKSVFLAPGDHSAEHPDLPKLSQKDGYSKRQVKSAALQAFVQHRETGSNDATVELSLFRRTSGRADEARENWLCFAKTEVRLAEKTNASQSRAASIARRDHRRAKLLLCASGGATSARHSGAHTPAVIVHRRDLAAEVSGMRGGSPKRGSKEAMAKMGGKGPVPMKVYYTGNSGDGVPRHYQNLSIHPNDLHSVPNT
ncbi:hypothetical protein DFJ73DRAFT_767402 [Zopfochytrium polystomum]|nr:hypothetical protein DFJ73DRAFT_767402 [Zopfochytrium polystomum]